MDSSSTIDSLSKVYRQKVSKLDLPIFPALSTFLRWVAEGQKFVHLGGGGSFYLLVLIAAMDSRREAADLPGQVPKSIGDMLRQPSTCTSKSIEFYLL